MWWRRTAALLIAVAAMFALWYRVVRPYRCNNIEGRVARSTAILWERRDDYAVRAPAEVNVETLRECEEICRTDVNMKMLLASNLTMLGRAEAATLFLKEALEYDRRPELHLALGLTQIETGERDAALANFVQAGNFVGLDILEEVTDGELRGRAYAIVGARHARALLRTKRREIQELIANGTFARRSKPTLASTPGLSAAAAAGWEVLNGPGGSVTTSIEKAPPGRSGRAMHVVASSANSGLRQVLTRGKSVRRVEASAWVYVRRGTVYLGNGNGSRPFANTYSRSTGRWEKLEALNDSCPSRVVMLYAATPDGADFYVADVTARQNFTAIPCDR